MARRERYRRDDNLGAKTPDNFTGTGIFGSAFASSFWLAVCPLAQIHDCPKKTNEAPLITPRRIDITENRGQYQKAAL